MNLSERQAQTASITALMVKLGINPTRGKVAIACNVLKEAEEAIYKAMLDYFDGKVSEAEKGVVLVTHLDKIKQAFDHVPIKGMFVNSDPRGLALKIHAEHFNRGACYEGVGLMSDFVGDKMLFPYSKYFNDDE